MTPRGLVILSISVIILLSGASPARADTEDEQALAARFAPSVRLVQQDHECRPGEPYQPSDVEAFLDADDVALRGPWDGDDLIKVGPTADDLSHRLDGYALDFPGNPLKPGCDYEIWARRRLEGTEPTVYAHIATEEGREDRLALQYWFYYPFNDYNNTHEGDWEMIQLVFAASDPAEALDQTPLEVGYSQHEGVETASWDDPKLERVDQTHPVVHPAAGSHASYYDDELFLGRSAQEGFGCDDTRSPAAELPVDVEVIPTDPAAAGTTFPWIDFRGHWGQRERAFFDGPTGPATKASWTSPITNQEQHGRDRSYAVPAGGLLGTQATDLFCTGVAAGSDVVRALANKPVPTLILLALVLLLVVSLIRRTTWRPTAPLRIGRRRAAGQIIAAAARAYLAHWRVFIGIGLVIVPVSLIVTAVQRIVVDGPEVASISRGGEAGGFRLLVAALLTYLLTGVTVVGVLAATSRALTEIDAARDTGIVDAYRLSAARWRALLGAFAVSSVVTGLFSLTLVLLPVALALAVAFALYVPVIELEGQGAIGSLRRSAALVRHRVLRVATLFVTSALLAAALGPVLGVVIILATNAPFPVVNVVAGVTFAFLMPYIGLVLTYAYLDARIHTDLRPDARGPRILPAEVEPGLVMTNHTPSAPTDRPSGTAQGDRSA